VIGSNSLSDILSRKLYFRRLKKNAQRAMRIEYVLVALLGALAGFEAYLFFGARGI
jgi:hypothetical protein